MSILVYSCTRLESIRKVAIARDVRVVLHGTNDFNQETMRRCIDGGVSKINVNKLVLDGYLKYLKKNAPTLSLTQLMEEGVVEVVTLMEWQMDVCRSTGKA
jgi:fructose-bisphosphate aldolase, class II